MDLLQQARGEIDTIDAEMAALFERRMRAVADVARYKAETGKPVFDAVREASVLDKNTARLQDETLRPYYRAFLQEAMAVSRAYQRAMLGRDTAAYQGVEGGAILPCGGFFLSHGRYRLPPGARSLMPYKTATPNLGYFPLKIPMPGMFPPCWICCTPTRG